MLCHSWRVVLVLLCACQGDILNPGASNPGVDPGPRDPNAPPGTPGTPGAPGGPIELFCDEGAQREPRPMRRLSRELLAASLREALGANLAERGSAAEVIPTDGLRFPTEAGPLTEEHIEAYESVARDIADAAAADPSLLGSHLQCEVGALDGGCVEATLASVGGALLRRPWEAADEVALNAALEDAATPEAALRRGLRILLQSPELIYVPEGTTAETTESVSPHELDVRRSLAVLGHAQPTGQSASELLALPSARQSFRRFVAAWLHYDALAPADHSAAFAADVPADNIEDAMAQESLDFFERLVFDEHARFDELFTSRLGRVTSDALAGVYGVVASDEWVELPAERAGFMTRAAYTYSNTDSPSPILRGAHTLENILCMEFGAPPLDAVEAAQEAVGLEGRSRRDYTDALTSSPICNSCHARINPVGFAFSAYDSLGRFGDVERQFQFGELIGEYPVDSAVTLDLGGATTQEIEGAAGLSAALGQAERARSCFAQQLYEYSVGREAERADGCLIAEMAEAMEGESLLDVWRLLLESDEFAARAGEMN